MSKAGVFKSHTKSHLSETMSKLQFKNPEQKYTKKRAKIASVINAILQWVEIVLANLSFSVCLTELKIFNYSQIKPTVLPLAYTPVDKSCTE